MLLWLDCILYAGEGSGLIHWKGIAGPRFESSYRTATRQPWAACGTLCCQYHMPPNKQKLAMSRPCLADATGRKPFYVDSRFLRLCFPRKSTSGKKHLKWLPLACCLPLLRFLASSQVQVPMRLWPSINFEPREWNLGEEKDSKRIFIRIPMSCTKGACARTALIISAPQLFGTGVLQALSPMEFSQRLVPFLYHWFWPSSPPAPFEVMAGLSVGRHMSNFQTAPAWALS